MQAETAYALATSSQALTCTNTRQRTREPHAMRGLRDACRFLFGWGGLASPIYHPMVLVIPGLRAMWVGMSVFVAKKKGISSFFTLPVDACPLAMRTVR